MKITPFSKPRTLCWDCANACGGCTWSDHWLHKPINGWTAVRADLKTKDGEVTESYIVTECPEFIRDAYDYGSFRREQYEGCLLELQIPQTEIG